MVMRGGIWKATAAGVPDDPSRNTVSLRFVTPGYFATLGIPLVGGRDLADSDGPKSQFVAVVSQSFAERYFPKQNPIGRQINVGNWDRIVVGVAGEVRVRGLERKSEPQVYCSWRQPFRVSTFYAPKDLAVRSAGDPLALIPAIRRIIREADAEQPIADVRLMTDIVHAETATRRTQLAVLGVFGGVAFLLAAVGIHGLLAFIVSTRQQEIGVRVALGASRGDIAAMMLRNAAKLTVAGLVAGIAAAYGAGRLLEALLAGVRPADLATYAAAAGLAVTMTAAGTLLPILRALRVDPVQSIRAE
jgi:putative ABC transport system permease protein